jgi:hypothetical protein
MHYQPKIKCILFYINLAKVVGAITAWIISVTAAD